MTADEVRERILTGLPGAEVRVDSPDGTHFEALVVAPQFKGLRQLARHQLVYGTLGHAVGREIHALSVAAHTPAEWATRAAAPERRP
jgi:acid stress-induced BolA-like protein IbaG/YrbA